jgi:hypothetical protein
MLKLQTVPLLLLGAIAGCGQVVMFGHTIGEEHPASTVKAEPTVTSAASPAAAATPKNQAPQVQRVNSVTIVITPQAATKVDIDSRFSADALLLAIKAELQTRKLFDDLDSGASGAAVISIDDYSMQPTSNVILFGNIISAGTLNGDIRMRDGQGNDLPNRRVEAKARVSIPANGESKNPLEPLYRQFAVNIANNLAGTPKAADTPDQRPR